MTKWLVLAVLAVAATSAHGQALVIASCGSVNYTPVLGQLHQLTMDTTGVLCVSGSTTTATAEPPPATGKPGVKPDETPKPKGDRKQ